jgi:hypothetical protein
MCCVPWTETCRPGFDECMLAKLQAAHREAECSCGAGPSSCRAALAGPSLPLGDCCARPLLPAGTSGLTGTLRPRAAAPGSCLPVAEQIDRVNQRLQVESVLAVRLLPIASITTSGRGGAHLRVERVPGLDPLTAAACACACACGCGWRGGSASPSALLSGRPLLLVRAARISSAQAAGGITGARSR